MMSPVALVFRPARVLLVCLGLVASLVTAMSVGPSAPVGDEGISRVELLD